MKIRKSRERYIAVHRDDLGKTWIKSRSLLNSNQRKSKGKIWFTTARSYDEKIRGVPATKIFSTELSLLQLHAQLFFSSVYSFCHRCTEHNPGGHENRITG